MIKESFVRMYDLVDSELDILMDRVQKQREGLKSIKTDLELFNYIKTHLLQQNKRSAIDYESCMYFMVDVSDGVDIVSCAVGAIMDIELYMNAEHAIEETEVQEVWRQYPYIIKDSLPEMVISRDTIEMLRVLQMVHDTIEPTHWAGDLDGEDWVFDSSGSFSEYNGELCRKREGN